MIYQYQSCQCGCAISAKQHVAVLTAEHHALKDALTITKGEWNAAEKKVETLTAERNAARDNHLKVMKERDAAFSLLDSFRVSHRRSHGSLDAEPCYLCAAAEKVTAL